MFMAALLVRNIGYQTLWEPLGAGATHDDWWNRDNLDGGDERIAEQSSVLPTRARSGLAIKHVRRPTRIWRCTTGRGCRTNSRLINDSQLRKGTMTVSTRATRATSILTVQSEESTTYVRGGYALLFAGRAPCQRNSSTTGCSFDMRLSRAFQCTNFDQSIDFKE